VAGVDEVGDDEPARAADVELARDVGGANERKMRAKSVAELVRVADKPAIYAPKA
jgi:hypothetical protein